MASSRRRRGGPRVSALVEITTLLPKIMYLWPSRSPQEVRFAKIALDSGEEDDHVFNLR